MKLWQKGNAAHQKVDHFTVGSDREYDLLLAAYDCEASSAHAQMLAKIGLLTKEEANLVTLALNNLKKKALEGSFTIEDEFEDMHSKIEHVLTDQLGDLGKKIHTARSRNDQVLVDLKLYGRDRILKISHLTNSLFKELQEQSEANKDVLLPGYTHLQVAMPS